LSLEDENGFGWLSVSLMPAPPFAFWSENHHLSLVPNEKKPLSIFIQKYFYNARLVKIHHQQEQGRVCRLIFKSHDNKELSLELFLFQSGRNICASALGKMVWAFKPKEQKANFIKSNDKKSPSESLFDWEELWEKSHGKKGKLSQQKNIEKEFNKVLNKKKRGLEKAYQGLEEKKQKLNVLRELGEKIKSHPETQNFNSEELKFVEACFKDVSLFDFTFLRIKSLKSKIGGAEDRITSLEEELEGFTEEAYRKRNQKISQKTKGALPKSLLAQAEVKGRTKDLGKGYRLYMGRSGKENLSLLRKAKPWFLWMHIRDFPGTHGILERAQKSGDIPGAILEEAARWVGSQSLKKGLAGGKYDVIYTECRYVRPIKGAKAGQVTLSREKVIRIEI